LKDHVQRQQAESPLHNPVATNFQFVEHLSVSRRCPTNPTRPSALRRTSLKTCSTIVARHSEANQRGSAFTTDRPWRLWGPESDASQRRQPRAEGSHLDEVGTWDSGWCWATGTMLGLLEVWVAKRERCVGVREWWVGIANVGVQFGNGGWESLNDGSDSRNVGCPSVRDGSEFGNGGWGFLRPPEITPPAWGWCAPHPHSGWPAMTMPIAEFPPGAYCRARRDSLR